jgi:branched-chain amino acid transport system substrate-binding protein
MATPMILVIAGDAAEGVTFPQPPYDPDSKNAEIQKFVQLYRAKYPIKPDADAAFAYDTLWVVAKAIERCENYPTDFRAKLADTNYHGLTGDIAFDAGGDVDIQPRMFQVKGGKFEPIP